MEYILYKKNIPILKFAENKSNIEVLQVYNKEHLPIALFLNGKASSENLYAMNEKMENFLDNLLKIILLDYIMANIDRHSYNISFIRDSNTLQWKGVAPVYDTGKSMFLNHLDFEMNMTSSSQIPAKPFYHTQAEQIHKLPLSKIASSINLENLHGIDDWYTDFLKPLKRLTEEKKAALVKKLRERIEETKCILSSHKKDTAISKEKLSNTDLVYAALKQNPKQTKEELSKSTGLSRSTITRTYSQLDKAGKIHRIGSNKTGYWEVL